MTPQDEARLDQLDRDRGRAGPDTAGQSGDTQGLSALSDAAEESVEELAEDGQYYEAQVLEGIEDAADHPERAVHTHESESRPSELSSPRGWE